MSLSPRLLRKLSEKGLRKAELEKQEREFSLYLNGANMAPPPPRCKTLTTSSAVRKTAEQEMARPPQTAGMYNTQTLVRTYCVCMCVCVVCSQTAGSGDRDSPVQ